MTDPFATDAVDSMENTQGASSEFLKAEDFVGRLLFIRPFNILEGLKSNLNDGTYSAVEADVHVIDGEAHAKYDVPSVQDAVRLNGGALVPQFKAALRSGGWVLGRMISFPGKGGRDGYKLAEPTEADWKLRDQYVAHVKAQRAGAARPAETPKAEAAKPAAKAGGNPFNR